MPIKAGMHTSVAGGLANAIRHALDLRSDTLQIFSRNPRGWTAKPLTREEVFTFCDAREKSELDPLVVHDCYLINLASGDELIRSKSIAAFRDEIERAISLRADYLVTHPGSGRGAPEEEAIRNCVSAIREAARGLKLGGLRITLENTAGQGNCLGHTYEQIERLTDDLDDLPVAVCLDTQHSFAAGYDLATEKGLREAASVINRTFGFENLKVIHCNDSKVPLGGKSDRHEHIGLGHIGLEGFRRIVNHPKFKKVPFILETPIDKVHDDYWNLKTIRSLA